MASTTPFWPKASAPLWRCLALAVGLLFAVAARAEGIQVKSAELRLVEEVYQLSADFDISFSQALEDALNKGVPLNFVVEFELDRPYLYWLSENIASVRQNIRVSYHALTRQYWVTVNAVQKSFGSLNEAKAELSRLRDWQVVDRSLLKKRYSYEASLRMKLDLSQLPKPLQVNAFASKEWSLESEWHRWKLAP